MGPYTFIDIHTHKNPVHGNEIWIHNVNSGSLSIPNQGLFSVGAHPWLLSNSNIEGEYNNLKKICCQPNVIAIGECGLDKVCKTEWNLQLQWFELHIHIADQLRKPLIIHCVKAFSEVVAIIKKHKVDVPVIFHGFNRGQQLALELIHSEHYLSFGKHLFQEQNASVFATLPLEQVFLETDASEIPIESIYQQAAQIRNISIEALTQQMHANFSTVFGISLKNDE